jgi:D-alanine-D-alanine ligase-like ATP-grasp enzyme
MTSTSLIPDEALQAGLSYEALVDRLVHYALARGSEAGVLSP